MTNYEKYRGKCKEFATALSQGMGYRLVRGYYHEPIWNTAEPHWWCVDSEGTIHDPTAKQFPSGGIPSFYEEFDGTVSCAECGKELREEDADIEGNYAFCSLRCHMKFVGL
jgi:hypothetical protein